MPWQELRRFPQAHSTLAQLGISTSHVDSVLHTARAIDAFRIIAEKVSPTPPPLCVFVPHYIPQRVGAVAVINEKKEIVGNISATDLKVRGALHVLPSP